MLKDITPAMAEEIQSLLLKLIRRSVPLEHYMRLEEVVHNNRCKTEAQYIYFAFRNPDGDITMSYRGKPMEKSPLKTGFLVTVLNSHLMEFAAAFSGKPIKLLPVKQPDLSKPLDKKFHDELADIADKFQYQQRKLAQAVNDDEKTAHSAELERLTKAINRETVRFFGLTKREIKLLKTVMEY